MNKKYERVLFVFASTVFLIFGVKNAAISIRAETDPPDAETVKETLPETSGSTENQESIASTETDQIDSNQEEVQDSDQIIENDNNNGWSEDYQKYYIDGATVTGFQTIDGNDYYFNDEGIKTVGQKQIDNNWYCFLMNQADPVNNGIMVKEQFFDLNDFYHASWDKDKTVYYDQYGHMLYKQQHLGDFWYCFNQYSGAMITGFFNLNSDYHATWDRDKTVYYDQNGHMLYKQQHLGNNWYCFNQYSGAMIKGFFNLNNDYHAAWDQDKIAYYDKNGHMLYKQQHLGNDWYCFNQYSGAMITGFFNLNSDYHASWDKDKIAYYDQNGHMVYKQQHIGDFWYCFDRYSGAMKTGFVRLTGEYHSPKENDKTVYYDSNGRMLYKQQHIGDFWYCFDQYSGAMKTGFVYIDSDYHAANENDKTVYYDKNGHMLYGYQMINGNEYYFNKYSGALDYTPYRNLLNQLKSKIESYINSNKYSGELWSVHVQLMNGAGEFDLWNRSQQSASSMKLFVAGAVYQQYETITAKYGKSYVDSQLNAMITVSSNDAWKNLASMLGGGSYANGTKVITNWAHQHGYNDTLTEPYAYHNYTSAKDTGHIVSDMYNGKLRYSDRMISLLKQQQRKWKIPSGVPSGIVTGNKTGELYNTENDTAIIYGKKHTYVLSILSTNLVSTAHAQDMIRAISSMTYHHLDG
ncbi:MAG: serine hydrolase [Catenisphaera adipataccumulans]|jgi:glucan-binding YG repeat protein|uniref:serine hydrolase n=1 Tax=Catenisphaera adipataccumulans TaxID=700500 RepID=UPI003D8DB401